MERTHQLGELVGLIAAVRAQGRTVRLALHNTDRFGLLHLYFERGQLIRLEGHTGGSAESLLDLESWRHAAVRLEPVSPGAVTPSVSFALDRLLDRTLAKLERAGVTHPAPLAVGHPTHPPDASAGQYSAGVSGLPPLMPVGPVDGAAQAGGDYSSQRHDPHGEELTDPQWQLLALAVRQITEHAGSVLGIQDAEMLLREALAQANEENAFLRGVVVDDTGWLRIRDARVRATCSTFEVAQAVALLLAVLESLYALRLGEQRVRKLIAAAVAPLRLSLEQVGLSVVAQ
ncbi:MAG TPA: hypothetical protein VF916_11495 [Ktedonobacterales bacterium]